MVVIFSGSRGGNEDVCVLCDCSLNLGNDSDEHIIINAIGGRYKVSGVLCEECNNSAGETWDSALAKDLQSLGLLIGIQRERGEVPSMVVETLEGEQLLFHAAGSMSPVRVKFSESKDSSGSIRIELTARSPEEVHKILKGVKNKYPQFDMDFAIAEADDRLTYLRSPLSLSMAFGGPLSRRSHVKSVLCFAAVNGIFPKDCREAKLYLLKEEGEPCFWYWYSHDIALDLPQGGPLHCVAVSNIGTDGQLLGYIEFFGVRRMVVCLADHYLGPAVHAVYCIVPRTSRRLAVQCDLRLSRDDIIGAYDYQNIPDGSLQMAFDPILCEALQRSSERQRVLAIGRAVDYAFKNCGAQEGEELTEEHVQKLTGLISGHLRPYLEHVLINARRGGQG